MLLYLMMAIMKHNIVAAAAAAATAYYGRCLVYSRGDVDDVQFKCISPSHEQMIVIVVMALHFNTFF